ERRITSIRPAPIALAYGNAGRRENVTVDMVGVYRKQTKTNQRRDTPVSNRSLAALGTVNDRPPLATIPNECFNLVRTSVQSRRFSSCSRPALRKTDRHEAQHLASPRRNLQPVDRSIWRTAQRHTIVQQCFL